jgi:hypothetical protein
MVHRRTRQGSNLRSRLPRAGTYGIILPGQDGFLPHRTHSCARIWHRALRWIPFGPEGGVRGNAAVAGAARPAGLPRTRSSGDLFGVNPARLSVRRPLTLLGSAGASAECDPQRGHCQALRQAARREKQRYILVTSCLSQNWHASQHMGHACDCGRSCAGKCRAAGPGSHSPWWLLGFAVVPRCPALGETRRCRAGMT